ncbi:bifunctional (p)ppGpp synthetase/guanosine-3',5'-bis(diphosphate) 3'-pyrophosphohydrolase [Candidatus Micrarchaeota archaeon]|nr:bifunctional (p)ppGpp synthetase/guanosine-3',5'-bis(diphosphate) 3'-pyrophosphohydrolase [Candidatus Micrarchaeota archaeon]
MAINLRKLHRKALLSAPTNEQTLKNFRKWHPNSDERELVKLVNAQIIREKAHHSQKRQDGTPYGFHPKRTAYLASVIGASLHEVAAAELHDVLEDTIIPYHYLVPAVGFKIANIVFYLTAPKLVEGKWIYANHPRYAESKSEHTKETKPMRKKLQKELIYKSGSISVLIVKLLDRLDNILTLQNISAEKKNSTLEKIVENTLDLARVIDNQLYHIMANIISESGLKVPKAKTTDANILVLPPRKAIMQMGRYNVLPPALQSHISIYIGANLPLNKYEVAFPKGWVRKKELSKLLGKSLKKGKSFLPKALSGSEEIFILETELQTKDEVKREKEKLLNILNRNFFDSKGKTHEFSFEYKNGNNIDDPTLPSFDFDTPAASMDLLGYIPVG